MNTIFKGPLAELKDFYSLAPNRAKDPQDFDIKITRGTGYLSN